jgi:hypothetical protein
MRHITESLAGHTDRQYFFITRDRIDRREHEAIKKTGRPQAEAWDLRFQAQGLKSGGYPVFKGFRINEKRCVLSA